MKRKNRKIKKIGKQENKEEKNERIKKIGKQEHKEEKNRKKNTV